MWKALVCLFLGHLPFTKLEVVVHAPLDMGSFETRGSCASYIASQAIRAVQGFTTVSLLCPRCNKIKVIEQ
jgi:hypothetical protein